LESRPRYLEQQHSDAVSFEGIFDGQYQNSKQRRTQEGSPRCPQEASTQTEARLRAWIQETQDKEDDSRYCETIKQLSVPSGQLSVPDCRW
jgi:hypothetical protein